MSNQKGSVSTRASAKKNPQKAKESQSMAPLAGSLNDTLNAAAAMVTQGTEQLELEMEEEVVVVGDTQQESRFQADLEAASNRLGPLEFGSRPAPQAEGAPEWKRQRADYASEMVRHPGVARLPLTLHIMQQGDERSCQLLLEAAQEETLVDQGVVAGLRAANEVLRSKMAGVERAAEASYAGQAESRQVLEGVLRGFLSSFCFPKAAGGLGSITTTTASVIMSDAGERRALAAFMATSPDNEAASRFLRAMATRLKARQATAGV